MELSVMKPTDIKKHLETLLINTQCSQLTRACGSRKLPVHHIITNQHCTCLPKSSIESLHLASIKQVCVSSCTIGGRRLLKISPINIIQSHYKIQETLRKVNITCSVLNFESSTQQCQKKLQLL